MKDLDHVKKCMLQLISILKGSNTQYADADGVNSDHEHCLFDELDVKELDKLEDMIKGEK